MNQNQLFYGDNLEVLQRYVKDESVHLCYIDPPFYSKRSYNQIYNNVGEEDMAQAQAFVDTWIWNDQANEGLEAIMSNSRHLLPRQAVALIDGLVKVLGKGSLMAYIVSMTNRIAEIHRTLKPTGSFYLHCDSSASHYLKIVLDAVFCGQGGEYQNELIWKRSDPKGDIGQGAKHYGRITDTILYFTKTSQATLNPLYTPLSEDYVKIFYRYADDDGRRYRLDNMLEPGGTAKENPFYEVMGVARHWRYSRERMQQLIEQGRVIQTKPGTVPMYKRYLDEIKGVPVGSLWTDIDSTRGQAKEKLGYPAQKPEALLERIIKASSNEGDVVLDAYCGHGTTVAVAQRLNRQWIGIDITYQSIALTLKRIEEAYGQATYSGITLHGVPEDFASAEALAHQKDDRTPKEFEKWAVLTYTNNQAIINEKKGGDDGIDGIAFTRDLTESMNVLHQEVLFSVKSSKTLKPAVLRELYGTVEREKAAMGYLITLYPMDNLVRESKQYGLYEHKATGQRLPKIQVISVDEILKGKRAALPMVAEVLKSSDRQHNTGKMGLF